MWKMTISFAPWEVNEKGEVRRRVTSKYDCKINESIDGYYYGKPRSSGEYLCMGAKDNYLIHRMVAEVFIPNPDNKPCVNHKDGNKHNNCVDNLEWVTYEENSQHAVKMGLIKSGKDSYLYGKRGSQHPCHFSNIGNEWNKGKKRSETTKRKISEKLKGNKNGLGRIVSDETRLLMSQKAKEREARKRQQRGV